MATGMKLSSSVFPGSLYNMRPKIPQNKQIDGKFLLKKQAMASINSVIFSSELQ
jgi:hypothetical protein